MKIISHADDLGISPAIDAAIIEMAALGRLNEVSCLVTEFPGSVADSIKKIPKTVQLGLHINLIEGKPLLSPDQITSLVTKDGEFHSLKKFMVKAFLGQIKKEDVAKEVRAQIAEFTKLTGDKPAHADSHQHTHLIKPISRMVRDIAAREGLHSLRFAKRYLHGRGAPLLPKVLDAMARSSWKFHLPGQQIMDGLVDPRFWLGKDFKETRATLNQEGAYEIIWHLSTDPEDGWRYNQYLHMKDDNQWQGVQEMLKEGWR